MRYTRNIILFLFLLLLIVSLFINIIIVRNWNLPQLKVIEIDDIYFDLSEIPDKDKAIKLSNFIKSDNVTEFVKTLKQKERSALKFYSFCGLINSDQKKAVAFLSPLIKDKSNVNIVFHKNDVKDDSSLGYAILMLIIYHPSDLINPLDDKFYENIENELSEAYLSEITKTDPQYKAELLKLISKKSPGLLKKLMGQLILKKSAEEMSLEEKISVSFILDSIPDDKKTNIIEVLLREKNDTILVNSLEAINEDSPITLTTSIYSLFDLDYSDNVLEKAVEKYALLLGSKSLNNIIGLMRLARSEQRSKILTATLKQISMYGNSSYYNYLKHYLNHEKYPTDVNLESLKAIVNTTYESEPENVISTMRYVMKNINEEEIEFYAINFHIDNNITVNHPMIMLILEKKESLEMKELALKYIEYFKLKSQGELILKDLSNDKNEQIRKKAIALIKKLGVTFEE